MQFLGFLLLSIWEITRTVKSVIKLELLQLSIHTMLILRHKLARRYRWKHSFKMSRNSFCSLTECRVWVFLTLVHEVVISFFSVCCLFYIVWKVSWLTCWVYPQTLKEILNICSKLSQFKSGDKGCLFFFQQRERKKRRKGSELISLHEFIPLREYYMAQEIPNFRANIISKVSYGSPDLQSWWEEAPTFDWGSAVNNWEQQFPELLPLNKQLYLYSEAAPVRPL